ncbi:MAG: transporter substrate-binding domain-containing protein [Sedimenticola sp.]
MKSKCQLAVMILLLGLSAPCANAGDVIKVCGEPWPPYLYYENQGEGEQKIVGANLPVFEAISKRTGYEFSFELLPWKRCLDYVANFDHYASFEIAADATRNAERERLYHIVGPVYEATTSIYYSLKKYPSGPVSPETGKPVSTIHAMKDFKVCGIHGSNYEGYYTRHGWSRDIPIDTGSKDFKSLLLKISNQRCDMMEKQTNIIAGAIVSGTLDIPDDIACVRIRNGTGKFNLLVSKTSPRGAEMAKRMTAVFDEMRESGELERIVESKIDELVKRSGKTLPRCQ